jgi:SpoVK/Ycf46/Vps4 family AAA+-type ATPase
MLIIGATNMPWDVDSAFKRPGRFDKSLFIPRPDLDIFIGITVASMAQNNVFNALLLKLIVARPRSLLFIR